MVIVFNIDDYSYWSIGIEISITEGILTQWRGNVAYCVCGQMALMW